MTHAVMFGGLMGDDAVCPEGEGDDGVAWALRTPGEEIETFIFGRVLDRITKEPIIEQGKRKDKLIPKKLIAERVRLMIETYRGAALKRHESSKSENDAEQHGSQDAQSRGRPKLPLFPFSHSAVMPIGAAGARVGLR